MKYVIYRIVHTPTGGEYIGLTNTNRLHLEFTRRWGMVPIRFAEHLGALQRGDHYNMFMQDLWTGTQDDWKFEILQVMGTDRKAAHEREVELMRASTNTLNHRHVRREYFCSHTPAMHARVIELLKAGWKGKDIAAHTGVSTGSVSFIRRDAGLRRRKHQPSQETT